MLSWLYIHWFFNLDMKSNGIVIFSKKTYFSSYKLVEYFHGFSLKCIVFPMFINLIQKGFIFVLTYFYFPPIIKYFVLYTQVSCKSKTFNFYYWAKRFFSHIDVFYIFLKMAEYIFFMLLKKNDLKRINLELCQYVNYFLKIAKNERF